MLSIIKLADVEYAIGQVALGIEEYYLGEGEAPGVWAGRWAKALGLEGGVEAEPLRALVNGVDPRDGTWWLEGRPARKVNAFDATFSAPKSVSLLWAFGLPEVSSIVARAHVQAVTEALALLEDRAAVARQQTDGIRTRVETAGWAVATFQHRTSRAGDPQLHTHCVIPNVVLRTDGSYASLDAAALYRWGKPAGCVYQEQLRRILTDELGVEWGPDRSGTREIVGFTPAQLRKFSKRSSQIEAYLERSGGVYQTAVHRMRADHQASLVDPAGQGPHPHPRTAPGPMGRRGRRGRPRQCRGGRGCSGRQGRAAGAAVVGADRRGPVRPRDRVVRATTPALARPRRSSGLPPSAPGRSPLLTSRS